ncbi:MAG: hypothetical protein AB7P17_01975 [Nitrospirales bacterium]|nr:hypothetical protein [Nitrospirales bacterium]
MNRDNPSITQPIKQAMQLFALQEPFTYEDLLNQYRAALRKWDPARYAGHTNNPGKYMQMYKKGESKTKEIQSAFEILQQFLETKRTTQLFEEPPNNEVPT